MPERWKQGKLAFANAIAMRFLFITKQAKQKQLRRRFRENGAIYHQIVKTLVNVPGRLPLRVNETAVTMQRI